MLFGRRAFFHSILSGFVSCLPIVLHWLKFILCHDFFSNLLFLLVVMLMLPLQLNSWISQHKNIFAHFVYWNENSIQHKFKKQSIFFRRFGNLICSQWRESENLSKYTNNSKKESLNGHTINWKKKKREEKIWGI